MANKNALELMMPDRIFEHEYKLHRRRLGDVGAHIDDKTPHHYIHLDTRLKQVELRERRQAEIDRENKILLKRMTDILMGRESKAHAQPYQRDHQRRSKSINFDFRQRNAERVQKENIRMAKRIEKVKPMYRREVWEADWLYRQKVLKMLENKKHKVYNPGTSPARGSKKLSSGYGSDFESDDTGDENKDETKERDKLPPIKNKPTQNGRGRPREKTSKGEAGLTFSGWLRGKASDKKPTTVRNSFEYRSPDPDLWMYYGIKPGDPEDENDFYYPFYRDADDYKDEKENKKTPANQAETDAKSLHKVTNQGERPHDILIKNLAMRSYQQRLKTKKKYKELYKTDLEEDLKKTLGGEWKLLIETLFDEEKSKQPQAISKVMKSADAPALIRRLAPLTNSELADAKEDYLKENSESLEHDISAKFDSPTDMLLLTLVKGTKMEKEQVSDAAAEKDAKALLEHGDGRWTSESGKFMLLLEQKTPAYMSRVFDRYKVVNKGRSAVKAVYDECPRDYADAVAAYIKSTHTAGSETIDSLHKNLDACNPVFVKTVVARSETDMPKVKKDYKRKYGNDLGVDLEQRSSHTTVSVLKAIINKTPPKPKTKRREENNESQKRTRSLSPSEREERREDEERLRQERLERLRETEELYFPGNDERYSPHHSPRHYKDADKHDKDRGKEAGSDQDRDTKKDGKDGKEGKKDGEHNPDEDAKRLYNAMKGLGTDEDAIVEIIPARTNAERQAIRKRYQELYKQDLLKDLKSETSGDFQEVLEALMLPPVEFDAFSLHKAMKGLGTDETTLIGTICSKSPAELEEIKKIYKKEYKSELEADVRKETSGDFREMLTQRLRMKNTKQEKANNEKAEKDASKLHGNPKPDTLREVFNGLSSEQIKATADAHKKLFNEDISVSIKKASSGDAEDAYLALAAGQDEDQSTFYADRLQSAVSGMGTHDTQLIRILVSRSEIDLPAIVAAYQSRHGQSLKEAVKKDTSGDYGRVLLKLVEKVDKGADESNNKPKKQSPRRENKAKVERKEKAKDAAVAPGRRDGNEQRNKEMAGARDTRKTERGENMSKSENKRPEKKEEEKKKEEEDAVKLFNAMKGKGTDEETIMEVITRNSNAERQTLRQRYQTLYKEDLLKDLKSETSGDFQEVLEALMLPPVEFDAFSLHKAMKGLGTDETTLIGIICSKTSAELEEIKKIYKKEFAKDLDSDVKKETSGDLQALLLHHLSGKAGKGDNVDKAKAEKDARTLNDIPTSYEVKALFLESPAQIAATAKAYQENFNEDIEFSIKKATSGDAEKAYLATLRAQEDLTLFYAGQVQGALGGFGTNDTLLIWTLVSRSEIDLPEIKNRYQQESGKSLYDDVKKDTSGDYGKVLLKILEKVGDEKAKTKGEKKPVKKTSPTKTAPNSTKDGAKTEAKKEQEPKRSPRNKENQAKQKREGEIREKNATTKTESKSPRMDEDATKLYKAMNGVGTDEGILVEVIVGNSNSERQNLKKRYQELYQQDLLKDLKSETSGDFQDVLEALMLPPVEFDAFSLHKAMKGLGTDETTLIGIICSKTPAELEEIKKSYKKNYQKDLEPEVEKETSGQLKELLMKLLTAKPPKDEKVDQNMAETDARLLHETPSKDIVSRIFIKGSAAQVLATATSHKQVYGEDIAESIKKACTGDEEKAFVAYTGALQNLITFYTERLHSSMEGIGTKETQLTRILVSTLETDLPAIKGKYKSLYRQPLRDVVKKETGGDYQKVLLAIIDKVGEAKVEEKKDVGPSVSSPDPAEDAIRIYKAMHRVGTEEDVIIDIVCKLSNAQRQQLKKRYFELYKQDLEKDLRSELTGDFEDTIMALMVPAEDYEARCLNEAIKGLGTDETTLIGIVCSKTPSQMETLKKSYKQAYNRDLEMDIVGDTSGDLRELLLTLAMNKRDKSSRVDQKLAQENAKSVHDGPTPDNLRRVLVTSSIVQAQATIKAYQDIYKEEIVEVIKRATIGDLEKAYVAVVKSMGDESTFYAERIRMALKGAGTNELQLTRIIIARSELDLPAIKVKYSQLNGPSLVKDIRSDTSSDYRRTLLKLLDHWGGPELPEDKPKSNNKPGKSEKSRR